MAAWYEIVSCICYVEWGLIHLIGLHLICSNAIKKDMSGVYLVVYSGASSGLKQAYEVARQGNKWPVLPERLMIQHGLNIGVAGCWSFYAAYMAVNITSFPYAFLIGLIPVLADIAYFIAVDIPHLGDAASEAQTYIVSIAHATLIYSLKVQHNTSDTTFLLQLLPALGLFFAGIISKALGCGKAHPEDNNTAAVELGDQ